MTRGRICSLGFSRSIAFGSLAFVACGSTPPPTATGNDSSPPLLPDTLKQVETASAVMPPAINSQCFGGRAFVVYGRGIGASRMASSDLNCFLNHTANCFQSQPLNELNSDTLSMTNAPQWKSARQGQPQNFTCNTNLAPMQTVSKYRVWYTDSLITRVGPQDLLHAYLIMINHPPKTPVPARLPADKNNNPPACSNPFTTCSLAVAKSTDCGSTWTLQSVFDLNDQNFMGGNWAVPEYDANGTFQKGDAIDRPEIFVDPYFKFSSTSSVFLTAAIRMGPQAGKTIVLKSINGSNSWSNPVFLPGLNPGAGGNPTVITATPQHRVYAFRCEGTEPKLYWSDDYGGSFKQNHVLTVKYSDAVVGPLNCGVANSSDLASSVAAGSPSIGITRWGDPTLDNVIVTYSAVINKVQVQPVILIHTKVAGDESPEILFSFLIKGDAGRSVVQATLTSTDRFEFKPDETNDPLYDAAVLYWLEIPSAKSGGTSTAKYMAGRRAILWNNKQQLSLNNTAADTWAWNVIPDTNGTVFIGDYNRGSFYVTRGKGGQKVLHFVSTWPQSQPSSTPNLLIHSNVINWSEP